MLSDAGVLCLEFELIVPVRLNDSNVCSLILDLGMPKHLYIQLTIVLTKLDVNYIKLDLNYIIHVVFFSLTTHLKISYLNIK